MTEEVGEAKRSTPSRGGFLVAILVGLLLAAIAYLGVRDAGQGTLARKGSVAPAFRLARYEGGTVALDELRGKVVMLDFWATWCPPCVAEIPSLVKLAQEFEPRGLVLLAANRDEGQTAKAEVGIFMARRAPDLARSVVFADNGMAASYRVDSLPTLYFIDREGKILEAYAGYASESVLRSRIERALSR